MPMPSAIKVSQLRVVARSFLNGCSRAGQKGFASLTLTPAKGCQRLTNNKNNGLSSVARRMPVVRAFSCGPNRGPVRSFNSPLSPWATAFDFAIRPNLVDLFAEVDTLRPLGVSLFRESQLLDSLLARARMQVNRTANGWALRLDIPGFGPEDVKVKVEDKSRRLKITVGRSTQADSAAPASETPGAEGSAGGASDNVRETAQDNKEATADRRSASSNSFNADLPLPADADLERVAASVKNGVLTIDVPRVAEAPPTVRDVPLN